LQRIILIVALSLLVACAKQTASNEITFAIAQAPLNLDPRYASDAASERVNRLLYQPLVDFDATSKPAPVLASWQVLDDAHYRFTLNKNRAHFHNNAPLTTADVKATYDSFSTLKDSPLTAEFANIDSIKVEDENTVLFSLKQADKHFAAKLIIGILPKNLVESGHDFSHNPIGNGALKFVSWQNKLRLQRVNDQQIISFTEVKDPTVRVLKLLRGEADLIQGDLPPELVKHLQNQPEVTVKTTVGANFSYLGLNMQSPVLKQLKIRQAIAHAINRQAIIEKIMVKNTREADQILPPEHYTNQDQGEDKFGNKMLMTYDYNPELSKKLLIEAGVKLPLKLVYKTSIDAQRVRIATILQAQMAQAGINLEIRSLDWGTFFADVKQGNFQLFGLTWVGIKTPEIYTKAFGSQNFPPNGFNRGRYADAELDKLLADENWQMATSSIHNELPYIPLWYEGQFAAFGQNISHYNPKPDGNWDDLAIIEKSARITKLQTARLQ
jgi:peptide/nickel transport system substrate-binding protein